MTLTFQQLPLFMLSHLLTSLLDYAAHNFPSSVVSSIREIRCLTDFNQVFRRAADFDRSVGADDEERKTGSSSPRNAFDARASPRLALAANVLAVRRVSAKAKD
jgi:hypothetical protein